MAGKGRICLLTVSFVEQSYSWLVHGKMGSRIGVAMVQECRQIQLHLTELCFVCIYWQCFFPITMWFVMEAE